MKNDLKKYIEGSQNAIQDEFILSRERCGRSDLVYVRHPDMPEPIYEFWTQKKRQVNKAPKHTGGKKPYVMLMVEELAGLIASGTPAESIGYLVCLAPYIEWGTGLLLVGRKKRKMKVSDIVKVFNKGRRMTLYIISELKSCGLLEHTSEGYFISRELLKKGGAPPCGSNLKKD